MLLNSLYSSVDWGCWRRRGSRIICWWRRNSSAIRLQDMQRQYFNDVVSEFLFIVMTFNMCLGEAEASRGEKWRRTNQGQLLYPWSCQSHFIEILLYYCIVLVVRPQYLCLVLGGWFEGKPFVCWQLGGDHWWQSCNCVHKVHGWNCPVLW